MKVINLHQEEKELILQAVKNNRHAQQKIYSKYSPKMLGVCRQYIKDMQQAEDVLITSFMKVFTSLKNFKHEGSFEGWIRRIIINECISFIRVQKKVTYMEDETFFEESQNETENKFNAEEVQVLIDGLPEGYKMIFNLYCIEGYKHQEIAKILGIKEGTSKSQLSHARKMLQENVTKLKKYNYETN
jgi:RNA polymerase sigma-70 factor (ECF subfamily)